MIPVYEVSVPQVLEWLDMGNHRTLAEDEALQRSLGGLEHARYRGTGVQLTADQAAFLKDVPALLRLTSCRDQLPGLFEARGLSVTDAYSSTPRGVSRPPAPRYDSGRAEALAAHKARRAALDAEVDALVAARVASAEPPSRDAVLRELAGRARAAGVKFAPDQPQDAATALGALSLVHEPDDRGLTVAAFLAQVAFLKSRLDPAWLKDLVTKWANARNIAAAVVEDAIAAAAGDPDAPADAADAHAGAPTDALAPWRMSTEYQRRVLVAWQAPEPRYPPDGAVSARPSLLWPAPDDTTAYLH